MIPHQPSEQRSGCWDHGTAPAVLRWAILPHSTGDCFLCTCHIKLVFMPIEIDGNLYFTQISMPKFLKNLHIILHINPIQNVFFHVVHWHSECIAIGLLTTVMKFFLNGIHRIQGIWKITNGSHWLSPRLLGPMLCSNCSHWLYQDQD